MKTKEPPRTLQMKIRRTCNLPMLNLSRLDLLKLSRMPNDFGSETRVLWLSRILASWKPTEILTAFEGNGKVCGWHCISSVNRMLMMLYRIRCNCKLGTHESIWIFGWCSRSHDSKTSMVERIRKRQVSKSRLHKFRSLVLRRLWNPCRYQYCKLKAFSILGHWIDMSVSQIMMISVNPRASRMFHSATYWVLKRQMRKFHSSQKPIWRSIKSIVMLHSKFKLASTNYLVMVPENYYRRLSLASSISTRSHLQLVQSRTSQ